MTTRRCGCSDSEDDRGTHMLGLMLLVLIASVWWGTAGYFLGKWVGC